MTNEQENVFDSILNSTKVSIGIPVEVTDFDVRVIIDINAAFSVLTQLGVGSSRGFMITGKEDTYDDFLSEPIEQSLVRQYIVNKAHLSFDPPSSATLMETLKSQIDEAQFRLQVIWDAKKKKVRR